MKIKVFLIGLFLTFSVSFIQCQTTTKDMVLARVVTENTIFQLFPTQNNWTFLKLDTRNGKIWQVHFTVDDDYVSGEVILNARPLVYEREEKNGRFTLYPTENFYNFLLLDQISGKIYQVQWSMDSDNRGIIQIN